MDESLRLATDVPPEVAAGEPVRITLRVRNAGTRPVELALMGRSITFDVIVSRADGEIVWRRLAGQTVPAILQLRVLAAGDTMTLGDVWDQRGAGGERVQPGMYVVQGSVPTDAQPITTPAVPLRIVEVAR